MKEIIQLNPHQQLEKLKVLQSLNKSVSGHKLVSYKVQTAHN